MKAFLSVVIPAQNEERTIAQVVSSVAAHPAVAEVIVVDNDSVDMTASQAAKAGARVLKEEKRGLGHAVKRGIGEARYERILRTDADISSWNTNWIDLLLAAPTDGLVRATFQSDYDQFPVTRLVVRPNLRLFVPDLADLPSPISGTYIFHRSINTALLPDDWSWDIALLLLYHAANQDIRTVDIGVLNDRPRPLSHYEGMAYDIHRYFVETWAGKRNG